MRRFLFVVILLAFALLGAMYAINTPAWQISDEPAHYNYIVQVAQGEILPVIEDGDWDQAYLESLTANRFAPELLDDLDTIRYENHQPPLYYWLSTIPYLLLDGELVAIRLLSVMLGMITVTVAYAVAREIFPNEPAIAFGTMALVAFNPQFLAITSSVNNDALALLVVAIGLLASVIYLKGGDVQLIQLGYIIGIITITKTTGYFLVAVIGVTVILRAIRLKENVIRNLIIVAIIPAFFSAFWFGRNVLTYDFPDILGLGAHDAVVVGQPRTADVIEQWGQELYLQRATTTTFQSYWGQFGWMGVPMELRMYNIIGAIIGLAIAGLIVRLFIKRMREPYILPSVSEELAFKLNPGDTQPNVPQLAEHKHIQPPLPDGVRGHIWIILFITILLTGLQFLYYNSEFVQFQGRYLFTAMIPLALLIVIGVDAWRKLVLTRIWILTPLAFMGFAVLAWYALQNYVVPYLTVGGLGS